MAGLALAIWLHKKHQKAQLPCLGGCTKDSSRMRAAEPCQRVWGTDKKNAGAMLVQFVSWFVSLSCLLLFMLFCVFIYLVLSCLVFFCFALFCFVCLFVCLLVVCLCLHFSMKRSAMVEYFFVLGSWSIRFHLEQLWASFPRLWSSVKRKLCAKCLGQLWHLHCVGVTEAKSLQTAQAPEDDAPWQLKRVMKGTETHVETMKQFDTDLVHVDGLILLISQIFALRGTWAFAVRVWGKQSIACYSQSISMYIVCICLLLVALRVCLQNPAK